MTYKETNYSQEELKQTLEELDDPVITMEDTRKKSIFVTYKLESRTQEEIDQAGHERAYWDRKNI